MFDYSSAPIVYISSLEVVNIIEDVQFYEKGWCLFQGTYWSCTLDTPSSPSIQTGAKAIVIGRKGSTLIVQAFHSSIHS